MPFSLLVTPETALRSIEVAINSPNRRPRFALARQYSPRGDRGGVEECFCTDKLGETKGNADDLILGCGDAIHYHCLLRYCQMKIGDRTTMRLQGIVCPYGVSCRSHSSEDADVDAGEGSHSPQTLAAQVRACIYYITLDDLDNLVDYRSRNAQHSTSIDARLKESGCAPLTHGQVADLRAWLEERDALDCLRVWLGDACTALGHDDALELLRLGEVQVPGLGDQLRQEQARRGLPSALLEALRTHAKAMKEGYRTAVDPYVLATTKACPSCSMRSTHYHGHACHMISPSTQGCPQCHVNYCFRCLSTEKDNTVKRGGGGVCECGSWHAFCTPIKTAAEAAKFIEYSNGIPFDSRCGCAICPDCRRDSPCEFCTGCAVCSGLLNPGPMSIGAQQWEPLAKPSHVLSLLKKARAWVFAIVGWRLGHHLVVNNMQTFSGRGTVVGRALVLLWTTVLIDAYLMGHLNFIARRALGLDRNLAAFLRDLRNGYGGSGCCFVTIVGIPCVIVVHKAFVYCDLLWLASWFVNQPHEILDRLSVETVAWAAAGARKMRSSWVS